MTPREKAKELVSIKLMAALPIGDATENLLTSKKCALIAVDEIMKENEHNEVADKIGFTIAVYLTNNQYWQQVKQEIEKM